MIKREPFISKAWILILLLVFYHSLNADGCFFYDVETIGNAAESPNQRALIIHDGIQETLILQVKYSGTVDEFAWVVPVPCRPEAGAITTTSDSIFKELHDWTQPRVYRGGGNRGWGYDETAGKAPDDSEEIPQKAVQVWDLLQIGPFEVAILSGSSSQALIDWLIANKYSFPAGESSSVDFYIQKQWYFIATRVVVENGPSKTNSTYQSGLPALCIAFPTPEPVFPLRISEISSAKENEIELYVAAKHRMVSDSYNTVSMDRDEVQKQIEEQIAEKSSGSTTGIACFCSRVLDPAEPQPEYDYEAIFQNKLGSFNRPTFLVEFAGLGYTTYDSVKYPHSGSFRGYFNECFPPGTDFWITRLRTILSPRDMEADVTFVPDPNGDEYLSLRIFLDETDSNPWETHLMIWPGLFLLPFLSSKRFRKNYWREWVAILLLFLIAI